MLKKIFLIIICSFPLVLNAQSVLTGNIFDNDTRSLAIEGASIKNLTTSAVALSNKDGHFAIAAKKGDLISFGSSSYQTDTVYLINLFPKNVYLRAQVTTLNTVNITGTKLSPYLVLKDPNAKSSKPVDIDKDRGGLRFNLGYGKFRREQEKIQHLEEEEKYQTEIKNNFTEELIRKAVKFEGEGINDFIGLYRPTVQQVKEERPFNYPFYIIRAYSAWTKLPLDQRKLPPLPKIKIQNP